MTRISFEYFPPKTDAQREQFEHAHELLSQLRPEYCSVTFGAGGSTLSYTQEAVLGLQRRHDTQVAPHLSCQGGSVEEIRALLDTYRKAGVRRIVALRGDVPSGMAAAGEFRYACDLVRFIRRETGDQFALDVACYPEFHPECDSPERDMVHFRDKVAAGADGAITQYFFNADAYFRFVDDAARLGVDVPIVPGIMPITNYRQLARFSDMCGAEIPRWLRQRLASFDHDQDADGLRDFGTEVVVKLCERLLAGGAPSLHFYTLNRAAATSRILEALGITPETKAEAS
ncbi:MAG: methylenetetrahydrofolate reductase [NAD(P)H] [Gammaproteobacteria bacterium]|nr:methylenetetrahydrofolate reductase [NAD(P)H] [Gammaproteobacteria bacterium]